MMEPVVSYTRLDLMVVQGLENYYPMTCSVNQSRMLHNLEYDISVYCSRISQTTSEIQGLVVCEHLQRAKDVEIVLSVWYSVCLLTC